MQKWLALEHQDDTTNILMSFNCFFSFFTCIYCRATNIVNRIFLCCWDTYVPAVSKGVRYLTWLLASPILYIRLYTKRVVHPLQHYEFIACHLHVIVQGGQTEAVSKNINKIQTHAIQHKAQDLHTVYF